MRFMMFLPLIVVVFVIVATKKAVEQKKRAEAIQRAEQMKQAAAQAEAQRAPVRPSVQTQTVRKDPPARKPTPSAVQSKSAQRTAAPQNKHPQHDLCALRPEEAGKEPKNSAENAEGSILDYDPKSILQGVIFSEVLGKPKALR